MNSAFWIFAAILALVFLGSGGLKLLRSRKQVIAFGFSWAEGFSGPVVKIIGVAEVAGAIGLILPPALGVLPVLSPIAATSLAVLMISAIVVHLRRRETGPAVVPAVLFVLTALLAAIRFVWCPF